jgi:hypothetical protein
MENIRIHTLGGYAVSIQIDDQECINVKRASLDFNGEGMQTVSLVLTNVNVEIVKDDALPNESRSLTLRA